METRTDWRTVFFAFIAACILVGASLAYSLSRTSDAAVVVSVASAPTLSENSDAWQGALDALAPQTVTEAGEYIAPRELPASEAISREIIASYLTGVSDGTLTQAEQNAAVAKIIERNVAPLAPPTTHTLVDVRTSPRSVEAYAGAVTKILSRSSDIREYELVTFGRSVGENNVKGSATLKKAATTYRDIESGLLALEVPGTLADEHLAVLNAISGIAYVTELMAGWNGDPLSALSFVDAFVATERDVQLSISALYRSMKLIVEQA